MSERVNNCLTWIRNEEDEPFLTSKLFDVNMRLFNSSDGYMSFILTAVELIEKHLKATYSDYTKPHGMSGANCGIPLNIISFYQNRGKENERIITMLNPKITGYSGKTEAAVSNCGSVRLEYPIRVERSVFVTVEWYDLFSKKQHKRFSREEGAFTIQHEVDHNLGILITDPRRAVKSTSKHRFKVTVDPK